MKSFFRQLIIAILTAEAKFALSRNTPKIVAITGSVGKTSAKDAIAAALSATHQVRKSQKSFNSEIGVPLAILGLDNAWGSPLGWLSNVGRGFLAAFRHFPEWLVLEVGADHPGDIKRVAAWLRPDVVVFTRFPDVPVHVEFFPNPEAVIAEKRELARALRPDGTLAVNADDPKTAKETVTGNQRKITFGSVPQSTVRLESESITYDDAGRPVGTILRVSAKGASMPITLGGTIGEGRSMAVLSALAVADSVGDNLVTAIQGIERDAPPPGRMRIIGGVHGSTLLDDTYNASPAAAEAALTSLARLEVPGKKFFALADMKELGSFAEGAHADIGKRIAGLHAQAKLHSFLAVGPMASRAAHAARECGMLASAIAEYPDAEALAKSLKPMLAPGDIVLLKGSQSMRMERAVEALMANPEEAPALLVRQEEEWKKR